MRTPDPRLFIGRGGDPADPAPQPLTVGVEHVMGLVARLDSLETHQGALGNPHHAAIADIPGLMDALASAANASRATLQLLPGQANPCPKVITLLALTTAAAARVRLYRSQSQLQADATRSVTEEPADGACLAEAVTTAGALTASPHPVVTVDAGGALWVLAEPATGVTLTYLNVET